MKQPFIIVSVILLVLAFVFDLIPGVARWRNPLLILALAFFVASFSDYIR